MNEKDFAEKLKPWLDRSCAQVGELQATRLKAARLRALDAWREPVTLLGLFTVDGGMAQTLRYSIVQRTLLWLPVAVLLAFLAVQAVSDTEMDVGELDALLLAQELPPSAFLDKDFRSWLGRTSD